MANRKFLFKKRALNKKTAVQTVKFVIAVLVFCEVPQAALFTDGNGVDGETCRFIPYAVIMVPAFPLMASFTRSMEVIMTFPEGTFSK